MINIFLIFFLFLILQSEVCAFNLDLTKWQQISDKHFKVVYKNTTSERFPREILSKAEEFYSKIADHIGYSRYQKFWTWDERVSIVYFSSQEEFIRITGQPVWSKGFSVSHFSSVNLRMIVTFKGQEDFLESTLPHEISHLILHDFVNQQPIPLWFDEGVAQLEENKENVKDQMIILGRLVQNKQDIPLEVLQKVNSTTLLDARSSSIFYAESLYIVDFLVKTYGREGFIKLCRYLRDGKNFEEALKSAYYPTIDSIDKFQSEWVKYITLYI